MNRYLPPLFTLCCFVSSCDAPPESYFGRAVLNLNMIHGFAGSAMEQQLKQPSSRQADGDPLKVQEMTRKEVVEDKIKFAEDAYEKVKRLKESDDTREMVQASKTVYEYILPVFRNEYRELARLYDESAPQAEIDALGRTIREKYAAGFQEKMDALAAAAKPYAERHQLKVNWDVRTSPGG